MGSYSRAILDNQIIISAVESSDMINQAITYHNLSPIGADALGRLLTITALMCKTLKNDGDYLTVNMAGDGVLGTMTACGDNMGNVKGLVANGTVDNIYDASGRLDVPTAVGKSGRITVIKDIGLKAPYVGTSEIISGGIAEDFANYFATSQQQPCAVTLGVKLSTDGTCKASGGVLIEVLPNCSEQLLYDVETIVYAMDEMSYQFEDNTARQVIERFFGKYGQLLSYSQDSTCVYQCNCSTERIDNVICSIGKQEAQDILDQHGIIEVQCHFCDKVYRYAQSDIDRLLG